MLLAVFSSAIGTATTYLIKYPIPVGLIATIALLFYKKFSKNPFKLSIEDLKKHIAEARIKEEKLLEELKDIERIIKRVEVGEIEGDKDLLQVKKKQLEEAVKLAREKIRLASMIIMIKENTEVFNKLFGKDNFKKLLDVEELGKQLEQQLKEAGIEDIDVDALYSYFNNVFPLILKNPEEFAVKKVEEEEKPPQPPPPPTPEYTLLEKVDRLVREGSVEEWLDFIEEAIEKNKKIKIPLLRNYSVEGYRNLLLAVYTIDAPASKLREVIADRFLGRVVDYFKKLSRGEPVEVTPDSSDREYLDQAVEIMCGKPVREETTETEINKHYKLTIKDREQIIIRKVVKDTATQKAQKVIYQTTYSKLGDPVVRFENRVG